MKTENSILFSAFDHNRERVIIKITILPAPIKFNQDG